MPNVTVSFELKYQGKKGDENFDFKFMGKTWHFRNIGTSARTLNYRVQGELDDMQLLFHNSGSGSDKRCQRGDNRRCRRRWFRRTCTGGPWTNCTNHPWSRAVIVHHFKVNSSDCKNMLARRVTSCDPRSGNVTKKYPVQNGTLGHSGEYTITSSELEQYAAVEVVPKSDYDKEALGHQTELVKNNTLTGRYQRIQGDHGTLQLDHDDLTNRYRIAGDNLSELNSENAIIRQRNENMTYTNAELEQQIEVLQGQNAELNNNLNTSQHTLLQNQADMYQDIEKENTNLIKENKDRSQTNSTFQQKTVYQNEASKSFVKFNQYMFYVYYVLLAGLIVIIFIKDTKNSEQFYENIYYTLAFIIFLLLYPIYIFDIEIYAIKMFNYMIAIFTSKLYNDQVY